MNQLPNLGGFTPSDLENMGMDFLLHSALTAASEHGVPPLGGSVGSLVNRTSPIVNSGEALTPLREVDPSVVKARRRPRSKASHLPPDIQLNLNTMLAAGHSYADVIRSLNAQGYPGFNKVNLHNWKVTGYQAWRRSKTLEATS